MAIDNVIRTLIIHVYKGQTKMGITQTDLSYNIVDLFEQSK